MFPGWQRRPVLPIARFAVGILFLTGWNTAMAQQPGTGGVSTGSMGNGLSSGTGLTSSFTNNFGSAMPKYGSGLRFSASGTGTTTNNLAPSNLFGAYYGNPQAFGVATSTGSGGGLTNVAAFGQAAYGVTGTTTGIGTAARAGTGTAGRIGGATGGTFGGMAGGFTATGTGAGLGTTSTMGGMGTMGGGMGASSIGVRRALPYSTVMTGSTEAGGPPAVAPITARPDLQDILARSSSLPSKDGIKVSMSGSTVVLHGKVANAHEARLAEALLRLTPGVHDVHNELVLTGVPEKVDVMPKVKP